MKKTLRSLWQLGTDQESSRFRVFMIWTTLSIGSSITFRYLVNTWQLNVANLNSSNAGYPLLSMVIGSSILPVIFTLTNGINGYHKWFNYLLSKILPAGDELEILTTKYGKDLGIEKEEKLLIMKNLLGFLLLELLIIAWGAFGYFVFSPLQGLSGLAYIADDLFLGALVFIIGLLHATVEGLAILSDVYTTNLFNKKTSD